MFNLTKKKLIIIVAVVVVYTIVASLIFSSISQTRAATQEEITYYHQFLTDWKAVPGVDASLSEKEIILSMCVLKTPATTGTTQATTATTGTTQATTATDVTQTTTKPNSTQGTEVDTGKYTSELLPKYLFRYKENLAVDTKDDVVILAYMDKEDHYVLVTYDEKGVNEMVVHNQKEDVAFFQKEGVAEVVTNFSFSVAVDGFYR